MLIKTLRKILSIRGSKRIHVCTTKLHFCQPTSKLYCSDGVHVCNADLFLSLTLTAGSNWSTFLALLHNIPASILGSIISIADMASNKPNLESKEENNTDHTECIRNYKQSTITSSLNDGTQSWQISSGARTVTSLISWRKRKVKKLHVAQGKMGSSAVNVLFVQCTCKWSSHICQAGKSSPYVFYVYFLQLC